MQRDDREAMIDGSADDPARSGDTGGGSATQDYGGMGRDLRKVDLERADDVGADPPGGSGLDLGGGSGPLGTHNDAPGDESGAEKAD